MNVFAFTSLIASIISFFLANFIYFTNPKSELNRIVSILAVVISFMAFTEFMYRQADSYYNAYLWIKISTLWPFIPAILLNIAIIFTGRKNIFKNKLKHFLLYLPAIIISTIGITTNLMFVGVIKEYYGWIYIIAPDQIVYTIFSIYTILYAITAAILVYSYNTRTQEIIEKKQGKYMFIGLFLPLILSLSTDVAIPSFFSIRIPELTQTMLTIGIAFISYGIWKYRFPFLTPSMAADEIISTMSNFLILMDKKGVIQNINNATSKILGYDYHELIGKDIGLLYSEDETKKNFLSDFKSPKSHLDDKKNFETFIKAKNGYDIPVLISLSNIKTSDNDILGVICIGSDLTERKEAERQIEENAHRINILNRIILTANEAKDLKSLLEDVLDKTINLMDFEIGCIYLTDENRDLISSQCSEGLSTEFIKKWRRLKSDYELQKKFYLEGNPIIVENYDKTNYEWSKKSGILSTAAFPLFSKDKIIGSLNIGSKKRHFFTTEEKETMQVIGREIGTAISKMIAENQIKDSLEEKEVLLREIHHRVKNNMQIISSLLSLQSAYLNNKQLQDILKESQNRVKSMALIHEKLYQSEGLAKINFSEYIRNLTYDLFSSYATDTNIKLNLEIPELSLDIDTAIPCGLIINEIVTNSLKYAFPDAIEGNISINLKTEDEKIILSITDDGVGLSENFDLKKTKTLGLRLVKTLVRQIDGSLELHRNNGTEFDIKFPNK
jgi:PAS domain S-box-containing protein